MDILQKMHDFKLRCLQWWKTESTITVQITKILVYLICIRKFIYIVLLADMVGSSAATNVCVIVHFSPRRLNAFDFIQTATLLIDIAIHEGPWTSESTYTHC